MFGTYTYHYVPATMAKKGGIEALGKIEHLCPQGSEHFMVDKRENKQKGRKEFMMREWRKERGW